MTRKDQILDAASAIETLLLRTQVDSFRVSNSTIGINFVRLPSVANLPTSIGVSSTGSVNFLQSSYTNKGILKADEYDFIDSRKRALGDIFEII